MSFEYYLLITIPYSFIIFVFILYYMYVLKVFKYGYTIGFMGSIWSIYNYILFPLVGFFYFKEYFMGKNIYLIALSFLIVIVYFVSMFIGFDFENKNKIGNYFFSILMLEKTTKRLSSIIKLKFIFFIYIILVILFFYKNYLIYGTINSFKILSDPTLITDEQIVAMQKSIKVYMFVMLNNLIKLTFTILIGVLLYKKKIKISFVLLIFHTFLMLSTKSKYVLVYPLIYIALYSFYVKKIKLRNAFIFTFILAFGIYVINIVRAGGNLVGDINLTVVNNIIKIIIWRADFFHGLYFLLDEMINRGMLPAGGVTIFSLVFRIIPRSIWPDRYGSTDVELTKKIFGFEHEKGWSMNFGGIGEFIYNFHLGGVILIGVIAGIVIYSINRILIRSIKNENFILVSFILSSPIWYIPWNIGINDYFGWSFILSFVCFFILLFVLIILHKIKI